MLKELFLFVLQVESLQYAVSFMSNFFLMLSHGLYTLCFAQWSDCSIKPRTAGLWIWRYLLSGVCVFIFCSFCFADILTMSTPWMTGAQPSVGCKCRSYNSWSCRYCPTECFEPNIYVSSSADTSSVSVQTPPCLTDISHGVTHRGMGVVVLVVVVVQQIK